MLEGAKNTPQILSVDLRGNFEAGERERNGR